KLQSFKNIRVDDFFCNFLDKRFCFFFLKLEQIFIFQRSLFSLGVIARPRSGRGNPHSLDCFVATKVAPRNDVSLHG
ncbi:MAG: hypothetical protein LBH67_03180, partial [Rickettsia sp.]|nr:hypothetical protein [Rickettsia sp.]